MTRRVSSEAVRALIWACAAFVLSSAGLSHATRFVVKDSGRQVADYSKLFWLDNERVLFQGLDGKYVERKDGFRRPLFRLYVWNTRTNDIKEGQRIGGGLCYKDGFIRYWRWKLKGKEFPKESDWYAGTYGAEVRVKREATDPHQLNWDTCEPYSKLPPPPEWAQGLTIRWLKPEHGLLVLGSNNADEAYKNTPIRYCPEGQKERCVTMPFGRREAAGFSWYAFKGAYLVWSQFFYVDPQHPYGGYTRSPWPAHTSRPLWWLYPDGRVRTMVLPRGPWTGGGSIFFYPTRAGVLIRSHNLGRLGLGNAGIYLVNKNQIERLVSAYAEASAVSPDGCRFAYRHDPYDQHPRTARVDRITLRVIELCEEE